MGNTKVLDIQTLKKLPIENLIDLYKQGYIIEEIQTTIKSLASCPSSIQQGTTKSITITPSGGTPPYSIGLIIDGSTSDYFTGISSAYTFNHTFNESVGNHTYSARVTDSCSSGGITRDDQSPCTINITSATVTICTWIGTINTLTVPKIMQAVYAHNGTVNIGFTPTIPQVMGLVYYYNGLISSGNSNTGCSF